MTPAPTPVPARVRRWAARVAIPLAILVAAGAVGYAWFSGSGQTTVTVPVGTLSAPLVNPPGEPAFDLAGMVGGDSQARPMTVTVSGGLPTVVGIYEVATTGPLLAALHLKIVEDGSTTVYDGPLLASWTAGSPLVLPGAGAGGKWPAGESHSFVFTVSLPTGAGTTFEGATGSLNFIWTREQI
jgi:hypothetical protein